ncbi:hypothetical protein BDV96DRAFT_642077 [Lophiotrema nucula]|uniref:Uncharacterized protein n=1 Tax=Lophiotrema nucula TaxID=690887 RepID=A0A6A5ZPP2_9PLEO|nr:hypothetical protein BDV96DRAFT_642077 [Lophiotrema nucula]
MAATPIPAASCPLLGVPREIRHLVYHHLWVKEANLAYDFGNKELRIYYQHPDIAEIDVDAKKKRCVADLLPPWLLTCKQLLEEGKEQLYRHCAWEVDTQHTPCTTSFVFGSSTKIAEWLERKWPVLEDALQKSTFSAPETHKNYTTSRIKAAGFIYGYCDPEEANHEYSRPLLSQDSDYAKLAKLQNGLRTINGAKLTLLFSINMSALRVYRIQRIAVDFSALEHMVVGLDVLRVVVGLIRDLQASSQPYALVIDVIRNVIKGETLRVSKLLIGAEARLFDSEDGRWVFEVRKPLPTAPAGTP